MRVYPHADQASFEVPRFAALLPTAEEELEGSWFFQGSILRIDIIADAEAHLKCRWEALALLSPRGVG